MLHSENHYELSNHIYAYIIYFSHIFSYILTAFIISQYSVQCGRLHFATFMCNINYKLYIC